VARGLGRALRSVLVQQGPPEDLSVEGSGLANARRRAVFEVLCREPCARIGSISREIGSSTATVRWHVSHLVTKGYVELDGPRAFPRGLIDPSDADLFALLAAPGRSAVLAACFEEPGLSLGDISDRVGLTRQSVSKIGSELRDANLITFVEDGRYRRHHPTDLLHRKRESNRSRIQAFVESIRRRLSDEGLFPETLRSEGSSLLIRLGVGSKKALLDLRLDPYATAWHSPA
jgi:DNA-binding transcriptional ArsR family regulator